MPAVTTTPWSNPSLFHIAAPPDKLRCHIEIFRTRRYAKKWNSPKGSAYQCIEASRYFSRYLAANGIPSTIHAFYDGTRLGVSPGCAGFQRLYGKLQGASHDMTFCENVYVDWTARQFNADAPFPLVTASAVGWKVLNFIYTPLSVMGGSRSDKHSADFIAFRRKHNEQS